MSLSEFFLIPLLNLFSGQVIRVLLDGFLGLPEFVAFGLVGYLGAEPGGKGDPLDLVVEVLELQGLDPLLVVECEEDLDWDLLDGFELLLGDLGAVEQPSQRRHDALQALQFAVPLGRHHALIHLPRGVHDRRRIVHEELDSLDGGVVQTRAHDVDHSAAL